MICVGPVWKPHCWFSHEVAHYLKNYTYCVDLKKKKKKKKKKNDSLDENTKPVFPHILALGECCWRSGRTSDSELRGPGFDPY